MGMALRCRRGKKEKESGMRERRNARAAMMPLHLDQVGDCAHTLR